MSITITPVHARPGRRFGRLVRAATRTAVAVAVAGAALAGVSGVAEATTYTMSNVYLTSQVTNYTLMLDVKGGSTAPGAQIIQWWLNGGANQKWNFNKLPDGNFQIPNVNSGLCMTTDGRPGDGVYQWYCDGEPGQAWDTHGLQVLSNKLNTIRNNGERTVPGHLRR